ncbi:MAG: EF-hand domain-containing protein [Methylophilaceae bacterium]
MNIKPQKYNSVAISACLGFGLVLFLSFNAASAEDASKHVSDVDAGNDGTQQTLNLNFSPENRSKIRKALDEYSRAAGPEYKQIEERKRSMRESIEVRFLAIDKDNDGSIDRQEATESLPQVARHFSQVDSNQDEVITLDELQAAQSRILEHRKADEALLEAQRQQEADGVATAKRKSKQAVNNNHKSAL